MTIVCATEFSEESILAMRVAADLAKQRDQILTLVHVLTSPLPDEITNAEVPASVALARDANELSYRGVKVKVALLHGRLGQSIGKFCVENEASLLVVGDTAKSGKVLATTLDKLAYTVEVPMVVVRDPRPFDAWVAGKKPLRVMLALDHSPASSVARDWLFRLAEYGPLDLVGVNLWSPKDEYARRGLPVPPPEEANAALAKLMESEASSALAILPGNVSRRLHLEMGTAHVDERLMDLAVLEHVDLIVLGTHRYRLLARLTSVSHHVLGRAPMSIACVPESLGLVRAPAVHPPGQRVDPERRSSAPV